MKFTSEIHGGNNYTNELKRIKERINNKRVLVGLPAGTGNYDDGTPIVIIGAIHEFGSADGLIPERSFLRVPLQQNQDNIKRAFKALTGEVLRGEITTLNMLNQIGARAVGYCQEAIEDGIPPANAESTVKNKGSSTPLIDKGILKDSITHFIGD